MRARIEAAGHVVLIAHEHPDADSLGSACAFYAYLLRLQKKVTLFCVSERIDRRLDCLPWSEQVTSKWPEGVDLAVAFDCGVFKRLGVVPGCPLINIDHHPDNERFGELQMLDPGAVSTTAILLQWFRAEGIKINAKMATALYAGIVDDTMGFLSRRTDAALLETVAGLAAGGAAVAEVNHSLLLHRPLSALRLKGLLFTGMALEANARVAVLKADRKIMVQSGADTADCGSVLHEALGLPTVQVAMLLCEHGDGSIKGTLRTDDGIDVSAVAAFYGGGGHPFAAGFTVKDIPMEELERGLIEILEKELK